MAKKTEKTVEQQEHEAMKRMISNAVLKARKGITSTKKTTDVKFEYECDGNDFALSDVYMGYMLTKGAQTTEIHNWPRWETRTVVQREVIDDMFGVEPVVIIGPDFVDDPIIITKSSDLKKITVYDDGDDDGRLLKYKLNIDSPLLRHYTASVNDTHLKIGCRDHPFEYWREHGNTVIAHQFVFDDNQKRREGLVMLLDEIERTKNTPIKKTKVVDPIAHAEEALLEKMAEWMGWLMK